jgi:hypothetical protein
MPKSEKLVVKTYLFGKNSRNTTWQIFLDDPSVRGGGVGLICRRWLLGAYRCDDRNSDFHIDTRISPTFTALGEKRGVGARQHQYCTC